MFYRLVREGSDLASLAYECLNVLYLVKSSIEVNRFLRTEGFFNPVGKSL